MQRFIFIAIALIALSVLSAACSPEEGTTLATNTQRPSPSATHTSPPPSVTHTSPPPTATQPPPTDTPTSTVSPTSTTPAPTATTGEDGASLKVFAGPEYGAFLGTCLTDDGNILAVGATNHLHMPPYSGDALLMKLTPDGEIVWERSWGGEGYDQAEAVLPADDGGFYIFGETDSYGVGDRDFFLLKVNPDGEEQWYRTYGRTDREWPYGMLQLSNGELLAYGFSQPEGGRGREQYALRLDPEGEVIWEYIAGEAQEELVSDAVETPEGDLVLAVIADKDGKLVKLDAEGNPLWSQHYELDGWQFASQVARTSDGGFFLAGFSMQPDGQADTWLARADSNGMLAWETSFGEPGFDDYTHAMIQLADGTYLLGGIANGILLSRVDEDGNLLWRQSYADQEVYGAMAMLELSDGGYLVAGLLQIIGGRSYDPVLLRTFPEN